MSRLRVLARRAALPGTALFDAAAAASSASPAMPIARGPDPNMTLPRLQARRVANVLEADGVARSCIQRRLRGPVDGDPGVESRRVEILVGS